MVSARWESVTVSVTAKKVMKYVNIPINNVACHGFPSAKNVV